MAGDIANRDITAGAPDAIVDMKYGNSYDPYIARAYKGDTLIYERVPDVWLYHIENVTCTLDSDPMNKYKQYQPEYIYYLQETIQPFSWDNWARDWEFLIQATPSDPSNTQTRVMPLFTDPSMDPMYNKENIGGDAIMMSIGIVLKSPGSNDQLAIYMNSYPVGTFEPYGPNDRCPRGGTLYFNFDKSQYGSMEGKDIHIVKQKEIENDEEVHKIYFYVGGILLNTIKMNMLFTTRSRVGSIIKGSDSEPSRMNFIGEIKYFKFRFTSDVYSPFDYDEHLIVDLSVKPGGGPPPLDYSDRVIATWDEETDDYLIHNVKHQVTSFALFQGNVNYGQYTITTKTHKTDPSKNRDEHSINDSGNYDPSGYGVWSTTYSALKDSTENFDGFGMYYKSSSGIFPGEQVMFDDDTSTELVTFANYRYLKNMTGGHNDSIVFKGGGEATAVNGNIIIEYDDDGKSNKFSIVGFDEFGNVIDPSGLLVIYLYSLQQLLIFDGDGNLLRISNKKALPTYTPSAYDAMYIGGNNSSRRTFTGLYDLRFFNIKFKSSEQKGD